MTTATESALLAALRATELFQACPTADLDKVIAGSTDEHVNAGELLVDDQEMVEFVWVVLEGKLQLLKRVEGTEVPVDQIHVGDSIGEIPLISRTTAGFIVRSITPARLLKIPGSIFLETVRSCASVAQTVLRTIGERLRKYQRMLQQRERMAGLGTISAGLAHELNNPAAAANRAAEHAIEAIETIQALARKMSEAEWSPAGHKVLLSLADLRLDRVEELDPVTRSDREEALCTWLDAHGVADSWELTAPLVSLGLTSERLQSMIGDDPIGALELTAQMQWVERLASAAQLMGEVRQSMTRITELVRAVKAYSHADHLTPRTDDVHTAIDNTLTMFGHKLRAAKIDVVRVFDRTVPPIATYGGELHQVWTNLIDNAIAAMDGTGTLTVRTALDRDQLLVEFADTGQGVPADIQGRIFEPFFTTKPVGEGTGLGLDISWRIVVGRHHGDLRVESVPGDTRFQVRLPLTEPEGQADEGA